MSYQSTIPYRPGYDGLAIYCSDGRFAGSCDDFLWNELKMTRCDRVVLPGGARRLVNDDPYAAGAAPVLDDMMFLIEAHAIERVVLIAHADCGYYLFRVGLGTDAMAPGQQADLRRAAAVLHERLPALNIEAYYAHRTADDRVRFEAVDLAETGG